MKASRSWYILLLGSLLAASASAQWRNVAPKLLQPINQVGAMQYCDGIVWAGSNTLWNSTDLGLTWHQSLAFPSSKIFDIAFFDKRNGIVATENAILTTTDGGNTWVNTLSGGDFRKVGFNGSASILHAVDYDGSFYTSTNGGANWTSYAVGINARSFAIAENHTIYLQATVAGNPTSGVVTSSTDFGKTWSSGGASFQYDCYTLAVDSCNPQQLYLVNEQIVLPTGPLAFIYISTDGGVSWQLTDSHNAPFYSGTMATNNDAVILGTVDGSGVRRSMDHGMTWNSIGGPAIGVDTRDLAIVNDNTILATDVAGSIWLTTNGGGDSVAYTGPFFGNVTFSANSLFDGDTLRCDTATLPLYIDLTGCHPPLPQQYRITGPDSTSFRVINVSPDSVAVEFISQNPGAQQATLVATLADGTEQTIALGGFSAAPEALAFDASAFNVKTDTIGGDVSIPIKIDGLLKPENTEIVLHYPLADLVYNGSFDRFGTKVDMPGEQWPGRSKLLIRNDSPGMIAAYAKFNVFSDTAYNPQVTFDSVQIPTASTPCDYSQPPAATATIFPPAACGDGMLSRWVHLGIKPLLNINPNPTSGEVYLTSSENAGPVTIEVFDMLGTLRSTESSILSKGTSASLLLPPASGVYYVRVISALGETNLPVVVGR